jgi:hypothetical protein
MDRTAQLDQLWKVVDTVRAARGADPEPDAGDPRWRHRLMSVGHDPLKPT